MEVFVEFGLLFETCSSFVEGEAEFEVFLRIQSVILLPDLFIFGIQLKKENRKLMLKVHTSFIKCPELIIPPKTSIKSSIIIASWLLLGEIRVLSKLSSYFFHVSRTKKSKRRTHTWRVKIQRIRAFPLLDEGRVKLFAPENDDF